MNRREFLKASAAVAAVPWLPRVSWAGAAGAAQGGELRGYFLTILEGFLRNARATSADNAVCDFPGGTKLAGTCTPGGKTYVSVARMLPAMAEWVVGNAGEGDRGGMRDSARGSALRGTLTPALSRSTGRGGTREEGTTLNTQHRTLNTQQERAQPRGLRLNGGGEGDSKADLSDVLLSVYRTAFDPKHPDYWGEPTGSKPTQRSVESSLVALALARLGPGFVSKLTAGERANVNKWLASCTVIPERTNNHAWFTAVNQAARIKLGKTFPEFKGDEKWMFDDLDAMDVLAANAADGWYSDDPKLTVYDYYNFWTFGNFPLFWSSIAGELYPDRNEVLRGRAKEFLGNTPYFFGGDGSVPLFGRSLLYRFALLSPLVMGYQQGIWPHSAGVLRRIVRMNMGWWWGMGAYDEGLGKLRETLSPVGTKDVTEGYIDNGHPYWAMQAFSFLSIPGGDAFWTAEEETLPVEKGDFVVRIAGPKMLLRGSKSSGQVRWLQARNTPRRDYYRDKYNKFVWSSAFPFNVVQEGKHPSSAAPWDQALVFRDMGSGACAARVFPDGGELMGEDGVRTEWSAKLADGRVARVVSVVRLLEGDFELRMHDVTLEGEAAGKAVEMEICEGSHALGLSAKEGPKVTRGEGWAAAGSAGGGLVVAWGVGGYGGVDVVTSFDPGKRENVNLVHAKSAVVTLRKPMGGEGTFRLVSLYYASPRPLPLEAVLKRGREIVAQLPR